MQLHHIHKANHLISIHYKTTIDCLYQHKKYHPPLTHPITLLRRPMHFLQLLIGDAQQKAQGLLSTSSSTHIIHKTKSLAAAGCTLIMSKIGSPGVSSIQLLRVLNILAVITKNNSLKISNCPKRKFSNPKGSIR